MSAADVETAIERAWEALEAGTGIGIDASGWDVPTPAALAAEASVREVGALVAGRAHQLAAERLDEVDQRWHDKGVASLADYGAWLEAAHAELKTRRQATPPEQRPAFYAELRELLAERARCNRGEDAWSTERVTVIAAAYREALAEQRRLGSPSEGLALHPGSDRPAVARLKAAADMYPTAWLAASNTAARDIRPLVVRTTDGRAHYGHARMVELRESSTRTDRDHIGLDEAVPEGWTDTGEVAVSTVQGPDGVTREQLRVVERQRQVPGPASFDLVSELLVDDVHEGVQPPGVSTALHELGHRFEFLVPQVTDLERTFLARRTTGDEGPEPLRRYLGTEQSDATRSGEVDWDAGEWVRPDGFVDQYVGKTYGPSIRAREVLSLGMEGVFAGRFGGLEGRGGHRADPEHRDLVLGLLATC